MPKREAIKSVLCVMLILATAIASYLTAAEDNAELATVYYQSGLSLLKQNKYDEALTKFHKALSYRPAFPEAFLKSAECCEKLGNKAKALQNYRLCRKCLETKPSLTPDEKTILSAAQSNLEKLDTAGKEFRKIKEHYISGIISVANNCLAKKHTGFAGKIFKQVVAIDPANKSAAEFLGKPVDKPAEAKPKPSSVIESVKLFNGRDLTGWKAAGEETGYQYWSAKNNLLWGEHKVVNKYAILLWEGDVPASYTFSFEYLVERVRLPKSEHLGVVYSINQQSSPAIFTFNTTVSPAWNKLEVVNEKGTVNVKVNGKPAKGNIVIGNINGRTGQPLGLAVKDSVIYFKNITLKKVN
ncbi:MAG: tetratricopeptide repeat protein [Planctomycetes bacterium]|nr:tetratricopeptide repeat protein [Planctomycetota bacterium]